MNILLLQLKAEFLRKDFESRPLAALLRKNYIRERRVTLARTALTHFSIEFRTEGDVKSTLNKTVESGKISKGVNLQTSSNKGIDYKSIA